MSWKDLRIAEKPCVGFDVVPVPAAAAGPIG